MSQLPFLSRPPAAPPSYEKQQENRKIFLERLMQIKRPGIAEVAAKLEAGDFFTRGCHSHHNYPGGLVEHSLNVYRAAKRQNSGCSPESVKLCALLHDVGALLGGQGRRSVEFCESCGLVFTPEERRAIRYHMGSRTVFTGKADRKKYAVARRDKLWALIHSSDYLDSHRVKPDWEWLVMAIMSVGRFFGF